MFRSTLTKIKKVCARAVVTSTCREKNCDGRFNRSPELRKAQHKTTKFEEQKQKCINIIEECFTPNEPYQHKGEVEENRLMQATKKVDHGQAEKDKCEKILRQCFGEMEHYERSAGTVDESKHEEKPLIQTVANERQVEKVKALPAIERVEDGAQTSENPGAASETEIGIVKAVSIDTFDNKKVKGESTDRGTEVIQKIEDEIQIRIVKAKDDNKIQADTNVAAIETIPVKKEVEDEIKSEKIAAVQKIDVEFQTKMAKRKELTPQETQHEIKPGKKSAIQKLDSDYQNEIVKAEGHPGGYLNDLERQQIETDLRNIHKLKDTLLYNDLNPAEDNFDMKRKNKGNKDVHSFPRYSANTSGFYAERPDEKVPRSDSLNVNLDKCESSLARGEIRENLEQAGKLQYREVLQTGELHYKQFENVNLNNFAAEEQLALHKVEPQVNEESPELQNFKEKELETHEPEKLNLNVHTKELIPQQKTTKPLDPKEEHMELHELEKQTNYILSADPPKENENSHPTILQDEKVEHQEPENFKISRDVIEPHPEAERSEPVNSKEEKIELFETDKLKMNTVQTGAQTKGESIELLVSRGENKEHEKSRKLKENVGQENSELLCSQEEIAELDETDNVKINIVLAKTDTEALLNNSNSDTHTDSSVYKTESSLKSVTYTNNSQIGPENTEIPKIEKSDSLEKTAANANQTEPQKKETTFREQGDIIFSGDVTPKWQSDLKNSTISPEIQRINTFTANPQIEVPKKINLSDETTLKSYRRTVDRVQIEKEISEDIILKETENIHVSNAVAEQKSELTKNYPQTELSEDSVTSKLNTFQNQDTTLGLKELEQGPTVDDTSSETQACNTDELKVNDSKKIIQPIVDDPNNVYIFNYAQTKITEIESNNKTVENNYTPQIDIAKELQSDGQQNKRESKIGSEMSEQNNYTPQILMHTLDVAEPKTEDVGTQLSRLHEITKHIIVEPNNVHLRNYTKTKIQDIKSNEKTVQNNYTPQIEIANQIISDEKETTQNNEETKVETRKTERDHYTPQIYLQTLNFAELYKENSNKEDSLHILNKIEPIKEVQIGIIDQDKRDLLRYTNTKMTELNHYSTQIYMDAISRARKALQPIEKREGKTQRENKEPIIVLQSKEPPIKETNNQPNLETLKYEAELNIVRENANVAESKKIRKNEVRFAQVDVNAIDQSLNQMLHTKPKRVPRNSASKCYKAPTHAEGEPTSNHYLDIQLPFDDTVKSLGKVDKAMKLHCKKHEVENVFKALKNEEDNYHNKFLHFTRDVGTSLIGELKTNVKERSPESRLNIDRHGNLHKSRSPSRRHRRRPDSKYDVEGLHQDNYYDKIATEWIRNEEKNVKKQFDDIASVHLSKHRKGESARMCKMPRVEDDGFLAKSPAPKRNKREREVSQALVANCDAETQNVGVKPRSSDEMVKTYKDEDDSIELERKISEMCIATSETTPFLYNEEQIIMGDMSRGPLYFQPVTEKEETPADQIAALETKTDYSYHKKAIIKLISNISHLRGFLDEGKVPPKDTINSYHDRVTKRNAMLYEAMVDTVTKAEAVKSAQESESDTTYYSAEDMTMHDVVSPKTHTVCKNPDLSAKITLNSSAANTDLSPQNNPPSNPKTNSTNIKNLKLTTTVFKADINSSLNNNNSTLAWSQRNSLSVDALLRAIRNYSYGSTSKPSDTKHEGGLERSNGATNNQQESPDLQRVHIQWDSTQIQQNQTPQQNMYHKTQQSTEKTDNDTTLEGVNKIKVEHNDLVDSFVEIMPIEQDENKIPDEEQQAVFRSVANYVKTDPDPKASCIDPSYANANKTDPLNTAEETLPYVEQLSWDSRQHTYAIKDNKPTEEISEQLTKQEQQYNNNLNYYERFLNYYEPKYEYAQQGYYNYYKSNETSHEDTKEDQKLGSKNEEAEKQCSKQVQTDEYEQKTQEQWSEQMRSHHNYYYPNGQNNKNYYSYERDNNQYYASGNSLADKPTNLQKTLPINESQEANEYYGHDHKQNNPYFQDTSAPFHVTAKEFSDKFYEFTKKPLENHQYPQNDPCCYAQDVVPPPSANYVPPIMMIQKPSTMQPLFSDHHNYNKNYSYYPENLHSDPLYTNNDENMNRNQNTEAYNSRQDKPRTLKSSYAYTQKDEATKAKVDENIPVLVAEKEKVKDSEMPKEEKDQATQETQSNYCYYYLYQNSASQQPENENQFNENEDSMSEKEQYNYHYDTTFEKMSNTKSDENTPKCNSQYQQESFKGKGSDHEYYDASSNHTIPSSYVQNTHNCMHYQYYRTMPDYVLNEYYKKHSNLQYPAYTHVSICPLDHKSGEKCESCCAEDTSRPNELKADEVEMKSSEIKLNREELRSAKPRIKKRKYGNRGSGIGAAESSFPKELELNTAINLPSLDEDVKLSELLNRVRKRNRLLNMVEVLKPYDPIQMVRCNDKDPPKPPDKPKTTIGPGKCPKCSPEPCRVPCPRPADPCDKNKPKDPCNRCKTDNEKSVNEKVTFMLYVGKKVKGRPKVRPSDSSDNTSGKSKAGVTQMFLTALVKLRKMIEGSNTSLDTSDSDDSKKRTDYESLKRAEYVAEKFKPRFGRGGRYSTLEHLKEGILHARQHITSGFSATSKEDETFYDA